MTIEQCEQRNRAILQAWKEWKDGQNTLDNMDYAILAEIFSIPYPMACQRYLLYTENRNHARTEAPNKSALKTIFNFIEKLYNQEIKERYTAKEENGKGYIYDKEFSDKVPCAVEKDFETATRLVNRYNLQGGLI